MITKLSGDELTAATLHLINNVSPHTYGYEATVAIVAELITPLTHEGVRREHVKTLLELCEDWREMDDEAHSHWAIAEGKTGSYQRHAARALQKVRVAAMAICEGGTP